MKAPLPPFHNSDISIELQVSLGGSDSPSHRGERTFWGIGS